ncbi:MAG: PaaX family transcriptional regulator C-terminal domain-containing protein [Rhodococcus sp. (in: high G+C Gram-positive bacteria)]|uniref:PaaX family transcriptional regulator n=1 Tax=Rhodococcus sp. TaxID=1831 RepID=UPI003BAF83A4
MELKGRNLTGASASALLFTVIGEYMRRGDRKPWTTTLVRALGALGYEQAAARKAVSRASSDGWLIPERLGRQVRWQLSERAVQHFQEAEVIAYGRQQPPEWDGTWFVVSIPIPEEQRDLRHQLRTRLRWEGFGPVGGGIWVSPAADAARLASKALNDLGVSRSSFSFVGKFGTLGDEFQMVQRAWDLAALAKDYAEFEVQMSDHPPAAATAETFVRNTELVHSWRRLVLADPHLPAELLPARWIGTQVATTFFALHSQLSPCATDWFWDE